MPLTMFLRLGSLQAHISLKKEKVRTAGAVGQQPGDMPQSQCPDPSSKRLWRGMLPQQLHGVCRGFRWNCSMWKCKIYSTQVGCQWQGTDRKGNQALTGTELFAWEVVWCNSSCPRDQAKPKANISIQHLQEELEIYFLYDLKGIIFLQLWTKVRRLWQPGYYSSFYPFLFPPYCMSLSATLTHRAVKWKFDNPIIKYTYV